MPVLPLLLNILWILFGGFWMAKNPEYAAVIVKVIVF